MHGLCGKTKFLQTIDIFQWVGWLVQIPACSVANLSAVFTSKLCSFISTTNIVSETGVHVVFS